jgi:NAD(P)-dependent dehydrogenase (short-subunit alcohol dehydrogenase family)
MSTARGRKAVFITGAASGIGLASAKRFAAEGWFVGLSDIDTAGLKAALVAIGPDNGATFRLDVRDRSAWTAVLADFAKLTEALDVEWKPYGVSVACVMPWFVETPILNAGAPGSNQSMADTLRGGGLPVYPVEDAAEVIWRAVHGKELHYFVGKRAKQMRFASNHMPGALRKQLRSRPLLQQP